VTRWTVRRAPALLPETARRAVRQLAARVARRVVGPLPAVEDLGPRLDARLESVDAEARNRDAVVSSHASAWLVEHDGSIEKLARRLDALAERQRAIEGWARIGLTAAR